jgi:hypothetical protein
MATPRLEFENNHGMKTIVLDGNAGDLATGAEDVDPGGPGGDGEVSLYNDRGERTIFLAGRQGNIELGGLGADGDLIIRNGIGNEVIRIDGDAMEIFVLGVPVRATLAAHEAEISELKEQVARLA